LMRLERVGQGEGRNHAMAAVVTTIEEAGRHVGEEVEIRGWLYNRRSSGKIRFLIIRDGTGFIQGVASRGSLAPDAFEACGTMCQESSVVVRGTVREDSRAPGGYELTLTDVEAGEGAEGYPITLKEHGVDFLMDHRHLWLRTPRQYAIMRVRAEIIRACTDFLDDAGLLRVDSPILTPAACEGTTTLFETPYFDDTAYLSQSGQLYNEAAAAAFGRVYCFGPTFRAEKSKTRRHLMEFWMIEPEMSYCDLEECMDFQERMISYVVGRVLKRRATELETVGRDVGPLRRVTPPFERITYDDAVRILAGRGVEVRWGEDLGAPAETALSQAFEKPVFVTRYPSACKAFYMKPDPERPDCALCADLLAPEGYGEITGGGQRIDDLELLERRIAEHRLPAEAYQWYLDLRRYGPVPHSGFGLGIERTVAWIAGLDHVRETIPFPRMLNRIYP